MIDFLEILAGYHHRHRLDYGHTLPMGEPWIEGSPLDHLLITMPYLMGKNFEICRAGSTRVRFTWVMPITAAERAFKTAHGYEALEQRFDESEEEWDNPQRRSVV